MGMYLTQQLTDLVKNKYEWVGDVRGCGLFQGVEIIKSLEETNGELVPYPELTKFLVDHLR